MASHRKPKQRLLTSSTARAAALLALTGAASTTLLGGTGHAENRLTPAQVRAKIDGYQREAEEATERYNGAKEKADKAGEALEALRDQAARRTTRLNTARNALGAFATAQYRSGTIAPALQLALSSSPDQYLQRASLAERAGSRQAALIAAIGRQERKLRQVRGEAADRLAALRASRTAAAHHKRTVQRKLAAADRLLDRLTLEQRQRLTAARGGDETGAADVLAPGAGRAARAVSYAYAALGKPYVWGATGPHGYDCSGLTQAAWRAAGVSLPRTTYTQINAGRRVTRDQLAPGDLVFFYSGVSHVGLYIGGGRMIHAPRPGAPVRMASVADMPFAGAARPA
ncbi:C40 family peptidase [Streptomyces samsunensis]|uniref:C40 family peptidase n=1 Tax=Streptomyces malaysiensis TaxID=92644 RepID=A0ABX6W685_STRMQ|nr:MULTISPECIES: C40 family peptidase [Streptomyces]MCQ6244915.1 C40 family peptidase [Streptomyces malaysiensis]MCD9595120.1 C40 family peptidase [Streptomyces sp. 8ZJF_21]NUH42160.1 C40 family peptidase [Streptomyces samsunensis]QPI56997.1 C40 family peptidase [Streptomyces solisilvae]UHH18526.1 C40 family peptidase [Streptomyces sp. HNM0561]